MPNTAPSWLSTASASPLTTTLPLVGCPSARSGSLVVARNSEENLISSHVLANYSRMLLLSLRRIATLTLATESLFPTALLLFSKSEADLDTRDVLGRFQELGSNYMNRKSLDVGYQSTKWPTKVYFFQNNNRVPFLGTLINQYAANAAMTSNTIKAHSRPKFLHLSL